MREAQPARIMAPTKSNRLTGGLLSELGSIVANLGQSMFLFYISAIQYWTRVTGSAQKELPDSTNYLDQTI